MRLVVQRVDSAEVRKSKDGRVLGKIGKGLFVLVGVGRDDVEVKAERLAEKLIKLRVMSDNKGKMNLSIRDVNGELLVVSQFTLYADTSAGNRPSFTKAQEPKKAKRIYRYFIDCLRGKEVKVETGEFGEDMKIDAFLDGPVTILLEE